MSDLLGGLALSEDDFGEAEPQFAMMVHARELDVFIRQLNEFVGGFVEIDASRARVFEKLFDQISVHFGDFSTCVLKRLIPLCANLCVSASLWLESASG